MSRGLKNNNPGNIRKTSGTPFLGEKQPSSDPAFKQFVSIDWGYRAMFKLLNNYISAGTDTIEEIINKYAPPVENNTNSYINTVVSRSGVSKNTKLYINDERLIKIVSAMSFVENGIPAVMTDVLAGYKLIDVKKKL